MLSYKKSPSKHRSWESGQATQAGYHGEKVSSVVYPINSTVVLPVRPSNDRIVNTFATKGGEGASNSSCMRETSVVEFQSQVVVTIIIWMYAKLHVHWCYSKCSCRPSLCTCVTFQRSHSSKYGHSDKEFDNRCFTQLDAPSLFLVARLLQL